MAQCDRPSRIPRPVVHQHVKSTPRSEQLTKRTSLIHHNHGQLSDQQTQITTMSSDPETRMVDVTVDSGETGARVNILGSLKYAVAQVTNGVASGCLSDEEKLAILAVREVGETSPQPFVDTSTAYFSVGISEPTRSTHNRVSLQDDHQIDHNGSHFGGVVHERQHLKSKSESLKINGSPGKYKSQTKSRPRLCIRLSGRHLKKAASKFSFAKSAKKLKSKSFVPKLHQPSSSNKMCVRDRHIGRRPVKTYTTSTEDKSPELSLQVLYDIEKAFSRVRNKANPSRTELQTFYQTCLGISHTEIKTYLTPSKPLGHSKDSHRSELVVLNTGTGHCQPQSVISINDSQDSNCFFGCRDNSATFHTAVGCMNMHNIPSNIKIDQMQPKTLEIEDVNHENDKQEFMNTNSRASHIEGEFMDMCNIPSNINIDEMQPKTLVIEYVTHENDKADPRDICIHHPKETEDSETGIYSSDRVCHVTNVSSTCFFSDQWGDSIKDIHGHKSPYGQADDREINCFGKFHRRNPGSRRLKYSKHCFLNSRRTFGSCSSRRMRSSFPRTTKSVLPYCDESGQSSRRCGYVKDESQTAECHTSYQAKTSYNRACDTSLTEWVKRLVSVAKEVPIDVPEGLLATMAFFFILVMMAALFGNIFRKKNCQK